MHISTALRGIGIALVSVTVLGLAALVTLNAYSRDQDPYVYDTYYVVASPIIYGPGAFGVALIAASIVLRHRR
jgi:hypothetical protein